jgi:diguanylate cyclase (GGDEF)-like protein
VWIVYGGLLLVLLAYAATEVLRPAEETWPLIDHWGVAIFEIVLSSMCIWRGLMSRTGRLVPVLLGFALMAWSLGDIAVAVESAGGATPPTPSVDDAFYVAFYPISYAGLALLMRRQGRLGLSSWLDGVVAGVGAAALCAAFLFGGVVRSAGGAPLAVATDLAYPVGDLLLLAMVVGGTAVLPDRRNPRWIMLAAGFAVNALGDTFNLFHSGIGATQVGNAINAIAWPTSILLVSASVWLRSPARDLQAYERPPGFAMVGAALFCSLLILFIGSVQHVDLVALILAGATLLIAGVRFGLSLTTLRKLTEERYVQSVTDQLTNLGNRRALFEVLDALADQYAGDDPAPGPVSLLFVDLDRFKEVNDSFGHAVGDDLLRLLGSRLKRSLRGHDVLVRLGGDEFALVLMDADAGYGATVAQRITGVLEEPFQLGAVQARIGASIGIATMPADAADGHDLLRCADLAMYRAKLAGESFAIYQQEIDWAGNRIGMLEDLRVAIRTGQLELHFQPQIDLSTREVRAVEALSRWNHPRLGSVPPLEFLPLAEEAELMGQLTALVLDRSLEQCAGWRAEGHQLTVAVNVSTTNLLDLEFPRQVRRCLERHGLPAEALILEITETTAIVDFNRCKLAIEQLCDLGLTVSVDDFGAGFTSLAYLSNLAVGELKLDRSFIEGIACADNERDVALVRGTIDLAHALGLRVVAEGVEDTASLDLLTQLGCDRAQGNLLSTPKPANELTLSALSFA